MDTKIFLEITKYVSIAVGSISGLLGAIKTSEDKANDPNFRKGIVITIILAFLVSIISQALESMIKKNEEIANQLRSDLLHTQLTTIVDTASEMSDKLKLLVNHASITDSELSTTGKKQNLLVEQQTEQIFQSFRSLYPIEPLEITCKINYNFKDEDTRSGPYFGRVIEIAKTQDKWIREYLLSNSLQALKDYLEKKNQTVMYTILRNDEKFPDSLRGDELDLYRMVRYPNMEFTFQSSSSKDCSLSFMCYENAPEAFVGAHQFQRMLSKINLNIYPFEQVIEEEITFIHPYKAGDDHRIVSVLDMIGSRLTVKPPSKAAVIKSVSFRFGSGFGREKEIFLDRNNAGDYSKVIKDSDFGFEHISILKKLKEQISKKKFAAQRRDVVFHYFFTHF